MPTLVLSTPGCVPLAQLVGKNLSGFKIVHMLDVYETDNDGRKTKSFGLLSTPDKELASAFVGNESHHGTKTVLVLTDGQYGYFLESETPPVRVIYDKEVVETIRGNVAKKLSPGERKAINLV